jgi:16S rRNA (cytosine967-C5)-methyltransferase
MKDGARAQAAIDVLDEVAARPAPADVVAGAYFKSRRYVGSKDRAAIAGMVYGVLRRRAQLDWWLERAGAAASGPRLRVVAWLALAEGWTMDRLDEGFDSSPFRPARLDEAERAAAAALAGQALDHLEQPRSVRRNYPAWIEPALCERFGADLDAEMAALAEPAPLDLRANVLKTTREAALHVLAAAGLKVEPTRWSPLGIRVEGRPPLGTLAAFRDGLVEVQDEGSQLAALLVEAAPGMRVVDFCAGAGGKSLAMAAAMNNKGHIVACDTSGKRLEGATKRLRRAGVFNVEPRNLTSERDPWVKRHRAGFDRVLVDAPCTGTGTWRRNPDAKWTMRHEDPAELAALQRRILDSAARLVKPGGRLVYATCSLLPQENESQAESFAAAHPDFAPIPVADIWARVTGQADSGAALYLKLSPARHNTDGFFAAVFEKTPAESGAVDKT